MKIKNILKDANGNALNVNDLKRNAEDQKQPKKGIPVVFAHVDIVNDNGLKLNADSIETTRTRYPLLFEHSDRRVEDVVGYIETDGKPNEAGEFVGVVYFYDTPQGQHAAQLWADGVISELSVSYYLKEYEWIDNLDETEYINVISAILKEVSIVSVGADRDTHEIEPTDEPTDEPEDEPEDEPDDKQEQALNASDVDELQTLKLNFYKKLL